MENWDSETMGSVSIMTSCSRSGDHVYSAHRQGRRGRWFEEMESNIWRSAQRSVTPVFRLGRTVQMVDFG